MLEVRLDVKREGEVGSEFWSYDVDTPRGAGVSARAGYVEALLMHNHYVLREEGELWSKPPFDIMDLNQIDEVNGRMIEQLRLKVQRFLKSYEDHKIIIRDDESILGDISSLLPKPSRFERGT